MTFDKHKEEIITSDYTILDLKSFSQKIEHTFLKRDYNVFNTYFGSHMLEEWGFNAIFLIITENLTPLTKFKISHGDIIVEKNELTFFYYMRTGYKKIEKQKISIPNDNNLIIDYKLVYPNGFFYGKNKSN